MIDEPLILVFYLDKEIIQRSELRDQYAAGIKKYFSELKMKAAIFFVPTSGDERIECINPKYIEDRDEINKLRQVLSDAERIFDLHKMEDILKGIKLVDPLPVDSMGELEESSDDSPDTIYSDLTEEMRNKISYYDSKYNDHIKHGIPYLISAPTYVKKGALFNQFYKFNNKMDQELFNLIEYIGDDLKTIIVTLSGFAYQDKPYTVKTESYDTIEQIYDLLNEDHTVAIYDVYKQIVQIEDPVTLLSKNIIKYFIRYQYLN
jgi:hypothetical protein